jgi:hypothetical protein
VPLHGLWHTLAADTQYGLRLVYTHFVAWLVAKQLKRHQLVNDLVRLSPTALTGTTTDTDTPAHAQQAHAMQGPSI